MAFTVPDNDVAASADPQSGLYSTDFAIVANGIAGIGVVSGCAVTAQGSPDMTVAVASGYISIDSAGTQVAVSSGNVTITTAHATLPRLDLVSVSSTGTKTVTAGTAATHAKPPDLPAGNVGLAFVYVPATDTTIGSNQITDKRVLLPTRTGPYTGSATLLLDYVKSNDQSGVSLTGGTWLDITPDQTITKTASDSTLEIVVRAVAQIADTTGGDDFMLAQVVLDSAGTPVTKPLAGDITSDDGFHNPFIGNSPIFLTGISAGSHTIKVQVQTSGGGSLYCRPSGGQEFLTMQVIEHAARTATTSVGFVGAQVYASADQTCNNSAILFNSEIFDTDGFHSTTSNTGRFTIPPGMGGKYQMNVNAQDAGGAMNLVLRKNGTDVNGTQVGHSTADQGNAISWLVDLAAGDYVEAIAFTGGANHTIYGGNFVYRTQASIFKLDAGRAGTGIGVRAYNSGTQAITGDNAVHALTLDSEEFDTDGFHSTSSNTSRITIPSGLGGKYSVAGNVGSIPSQNGYAIGALYKNGSTYIAGSSNAIGLVNTGFQTVPVQAVVDLAAGDYIEIVYLTNGTGPFGSATPRDATMLEVMRMDSGAPATTWTEVDGSPAVVPTTAKFPNGSLTDQGSGSLLIQPPGTLLVCQRYASGSDTQYTTTSTTAAGVDIDSTNLIFTFTAPATGKVLVKLWGAWYMNSVSNFVYGMLRDGSGQVSGSTVEGINDPQSGSIIVRTAPVFLVTGLTVGNSYTWRWAWKVSAGTGTLYHGPTYGSLITEVVVAP